jgi:hypothetical protein
VELLIKPEILTSYMYGPTFGNAESRLFLFAAECFNTESMQNVFLCHSCSYMFQLHSHHQTFTTIICRAHMLNAYAMWDPSSEAKYLHVKKHEPFSKLKTVNRRYVELRRITYMPHILRYIFTLYY